MRTLKTQDFTRHDPSDPTVKMAKKMAVFYRNLLKSENVRGRPFNADVPIELQGVFTHFVKAARIVIEEDGDPEQYIRSQFLGLAWTGRFPMPSQLATSNARLRYMEYQQKQENNATKQVGKDDYLVDEYELQDVKLRKLMKATGIEDERLALRMFGKQFTIAYLRSKGARS